MFLCLFVFLSFFWPHHTTCGTFLIRDQNSAPRSGSLESPPLDHQGNTNAFLFIKRIDCIKTVRMHKKPQIAIIQGEFGTWQIGE